MLHHRTLPNQVSFLQSVPHAPTLKTITMQTFSEAQCIKRSSATAGTGFLVRCKAATKSAKCQISNHEHQPKTTHKFQTRILTPPNPHIHCSRKSQNSSCYPLTVRKGVIVLSGIPKDQRDETKNLLTDTTTQNTSREYSCIKTPLGSYPIFLSFSFLEIISQEKMFELRRWQIYLVVERCPASYLSQRDRRYRFVRRPRGDNWALKTIVQNTNTPTNATFCHIPTSKTRTRERG